VRWLLRWRFEEVISMKRQGRVLVFTLFSAVVVLCLTQAATLLGCDSCARDGATTGTPEPAAPVSEATLAAGQKLFEGKCAACHSVGSGDIVGPDLRDVHQRRERDWLVRWMKDPINMAKQDPIGQELFARYRNIPMPPPGLSDEEIGQVLDYVQHQSGQVAAAPPPPEEGPATLNEQELTDAKQIYFNRCAGCHGTLRAGATGPNIQPARTKQLGTRALRTILTNGLPGGMPAWGRLGIMTEQEIDLMARYVQNDPPAPPPRPIEQIRESWDLRVPVASRPRAAPAGRNWENYFGVILRDAGQVAIIDGDTHQMVSVVDTGFAVHILRSSSSGRYFYAVGRDGRVTMIDLWAETPNIVAQVQGCTDARSVDASKYRGYEDKYIIEGCYWPAQYVVLDGQTLEPATVIDVAGAAYDAPEENLTEVRVAAIIASHNDPVWIVALKESGHVAIVDYSQPGFPIVRRVGAERFLHDGGWDHTGRYFMVAANMRNQMAVIDVQEQQFVTKFETGIKPHPGRGANWEDPQFGWVNATVHIGEGRFAVYGADPQNHPEHAWKVVRNLTFEGTGSLFLKTHVNSPWVLFDSPLSNNDNQTRQICAYAKATGTIDRCWQAADHGRVTHFEFNREGTEVWASVWDRRGEIIVYDARTLEERHRITGDWLVTPTGKFNVHNTAHDIY
jgi:nitrite reductase (NO-forming)/hydroxylamine reductase